MYKFATAQDEELAKQLKVTIDGLTVELRTENEKWPTLTDRPSKIACTKRIHQIEADIAEAKKMYPTMVIDELAGIKQIFRQLTKAVKPYAEMQAMAAQKMMEDPMAFIASYATEMVKAQTEFQLGWELTKYLQYAGTSHEGGLTAKLALETITEFEQRLIRKLLDTQSHTWSGAFHNPTSMTENDAIASWIKWELQYVKQTAMAVAEEVAKKA